MESWSAPMFIFAAIACMALAEHIAQSIFNAKSAAFLHSLPIVKFNTGGSSNGQNRPINTRSPRMNTARHEFATIQAARAFYKKSRGNRMTRHGYYACADSLAACIVRHGNFYIGDAKL